MSKAKSASSTLKPNPDAELLAMIQRHDTLWVEWDRAEEDDPRTSEFCEECCELELRVVATPAFTRQGLQGKRRVAKRAEQLHDDYGLLDQILQNDAERVAAGSKTRATRPQAAAGASA